MRRALGASKLPAHAVVGCAQRLPPVPNENTRIVDIEPA
jgi:hypothetical protein